MSVLLLHSTQFQALGTLVMGLDGMDGIFKVTVSRKLDVKFRFSNFFRVNQVTFGAAYKT